MAKMKKNNKILDMMLRNKKNKSEHKLISFIFSFHTHSTTLLNFDKLSDHVVA